MWSGATEPMSVRMAGIVLMGRLQVARPLAPMSTVSMVVVTMRFSFNLRARMGFLPFTLSEAFTQGTPHRRCRTHCAWSRRAKPPTMPTIAPTLAPTLIAERPEWGVI